MTKILGLLLACVAASSWAQVSCQNIGTMTMCSDGTTYNRIGNQTYGSDGSSSQRIGSQIYGTDGRGNNWNGQQIGNQTFGSDTNGNPWNAQRIGNQMIINGSGRQVTCQQIGFQTVCN